MDPRLLNAIYIVLGSLGILGNSIILLLPIRLRKMRAKEFYLSYMLAAAEWLRCYATLSSGITRLRLYLGGQYSERVHVTECLMRTHTHAFAWSHPLVHMTTLAICMDRVFALSRPMKYYTMSTSYGRRIIAIIMCLGTGNFLWLLVTGVERSMTETNATMSITCVHAYAEWLNSASFGLLFVLDCFTMVLTLVMIGLVYHSRKKISPGGTLKNVSVAVHKRNIRVTQMLLIVLVVGLFFSVIPSFMLMVATQWPPSTLRTDVVQVGTCFRVLNSITNIVVYYTRNDEMRTAIETVVKCGNDKDLGRFNTTLPSQSHHVTSQHPHDRRFTANKY